MVRQKSKKAKKRKRLIQNSLLEYLQKGNSSELLIVTDSREAREASDVCLFLGLKPFILPDFRAHFGDDLRSYKDELDELNKTLHEYFKAKSKKILISPVGTVSKPLPKKELFKEHKFSFGDRLDLNELKSMLYFWGYEFVDIIESVGEVSQRGDIIDIYPPNSENPYRISLLDRDIESIRAFDVESQKSEKAEIESFVIIPALFGLDTVSHKSVSERVAELDYDVFIKDIRSLGLWALDDLATLYFKELKSAIYEEVLSECELEALKSITIIKKESRYSEISPINPKGLLEAHRQKNITVIAKNEAVYKQFDLPSNIEYKRLIAPYIINLLSSDELIISLNKYEKPKKQKKNSLAIDELKVGDYVVHENYGIGIFEGIVQTKVLGAVRDFVSVAYMGEDKLLLPVENIGMIDRYIAESGSIPQLDRLGKGSFAKLKNSVKEKLLAIANEIVAMAARRELISAPKIEVDNRELASFQQRSGFSYTKDQDKAVEEILKDLSSGLVMDRLLSGDVGFGKTEVAMNAIFAVVKAGYQACMICPTTLLSSQHFESLHERLGGYGIRVAKLDRFVSAKEKKSTLDGLKNGEIGVVVGTHAILGAEFEKLALAIIDEEHKFGVKQKERIKEMRSNTHLLSMSATPIPRTLNMALSHIKGLSELREPPSERIGVRTFVKEHDEKLIKEAIQRELRRGGQLFYIHNNIASIEDKRKELLDILPTLRTKTLHSQVDNDITEQIMIDFAHKKVDMLISTSIVESGIHLPNANTMIIDGANRFGIADLHQLRGRVGRGNREGFCYFLVENKEELTDEAKRRLIALESNSYLGSGGALAYHDLEIRGGGNLLGEAQSGHIKHIGYALYLRLLEEAINSLSAKETKEQKEVDLKLTVNAFISPEIVAEDRLRLELYRRLGRCETPKEVHEIESEIIDRFGKPDVYTRQFLELIIIKILAAKKGIKQIMNYAQNITIVYENDKKEQITAKSKDEDDILACVMGWLRGR